jgi:small subunit ribosomal protein S6
MPKYELMYILSSAVSDNDVPAISTEVDKFITDNGGKLLTQEMLGKKKLAYPIKKTRNGFYVLETFNLEGKALQALDNKLRSMEPIIRYLVVALDEQEKRAEKDAKVQASMRANRKPMADKPEGEPVKLSESELDQKIEKALADDITK